jgi:hypothetical protein
MNASPESVTDSQNQPARRRAAVVLVFDRLQPAFLGPYGGTACETPACNRLAAEGYVAEQCYADSAELESIYLSYWSGRHALQQTPQQISQQISQQTPQQTPQQTLGANDVIAPTEAPSTAMLCVEKLPVEASSEDSTAIESSPAGRSLAERLEAAGIRTELLTDDPRIASHRWSEGFGNRLAIDHGAPPTEAETAGAMRVAQVLAAAAERLEQWEPDESPSLLWLHAAAWDDAWDAPYEFRQQWADPEDPIPPAFSAPPQRDSGAAIDHDELLGYVQAYVGQVAAWDACLEAFLESFQASPLADNALLIVTSPRGYPLGEHGRVGDVAPLLFNEILQLPLFIRFPRGGCPLVRDQGLIQPADLYATLLDWFGVAPTPTAPESKEGTPSALATEPASALETTTAAIPEAAILAAAIPALATFADDDVEPDAQDIARFASATPWGRSLLTRAQALPDAPRRIAAATAPGQLVVRTPHWLLRIAEASHATSPGGSRPELFVKPDDRWEANEVGSRCESDVQSLLTLANALRRATLRR